MVYNYFDYVHKSIRAPKVFSLLLIGVLSGCSLNSGLQAGVLPDNGVFTAGNGIQFNIQPLNLATLPPQQTTIPTNDLFYLIKTSGRSNYDIAKGDILNIALIGYPDITPANNTGFPVDQQGFIQFPLIGRIKASGISVPQFTADLRTRLQRYLKYSDPQIKIMSYRGNKFFIDGDVKQPGEFTITDTPVSLYGAISMAGGVATTGDSNNIVLNRNGKNYPLGMQLLRQMGSSGNQLYLRDGDSIHVNSQSRNRVYVLGEFGKVEPVSIPEQGLSLAQVLGESKGLDPSTANAAKVYIVRDNPKSQLTDIYYINLQTVTNLALASRFDMQPNDILYVDPTGLARWNRIISLILPSTTTISTVSGI